MERKKPNFLQKLYSREVHGSFFRGRPVVHNKALKLFGGSIPDRLIFLLEDMFDGRTDHVLVGTSRCGQFILTYTMNLRQLMQTQYKYRLHWWAFRGASPAHKVAEVQLFDSQDISHPLHVGIAQWPNLNDRLIAYGYSDDSDQSYLDDAALSDLDSSLANRKLYITVTSLPSLDNCRDCKAVAESFDEEDMAASWDSPISFSCLKHGLTIHTTLDVAPPYPTFDPHTCLKIDNKIIVNTGNLLHVLSFALNRKGKTSTERDTIVPDEISHRIGETLSNDLKDYKCPWIKSGDKSSLSFPYRKTLSKSINNYWLNTIMDKANKVYAFEESDDGCEPRFKWYKKRRLADKMYEFCSDDEDMENKCPPAKISRPDRKIVTDSPVKREERELDPDHRYTHPRPVITSGDTAVPLVIPEGPLFFKTVLPNFRRGRTEQTSDRVSVPNSSICDSDVSNKCDSTNNNLNKPGSQQKNSTIETDFKPQIDLCDPESLELERLCATRSSTSEPKLASVDTNHSCTNNSKKSSNTQPSLVCDSHPVSSTSGSKAMPSKSDYPNHTVTPLDISVINPDLSAILAEWEADSVSSLSPRSESLSKNDVIQSFLELIPGITISPRSSGTSSSTGTSGHLSPKVNDGAHSASKMSSPNPSSANKYSPMLVVLRARNCNQDKEPQKSREQDERLKALSKEDVVSKVKSSKEPDLSLRQRMISGCSVRFDRIYIELDDEIVSTPSTDFDDDDLGTGFHCPLPLSVHGSAYAQLQMVSSQKVEKLGMNCERVDQTSFDIEQFCFKAADIICQCEGFKFWFCSDYDVELIDVCAFNDDIVGVVCMRVNAEKKPSKNDNYSKVNQRYFYGMKCVFVWNPVADRCWLEAYSPLVETQQVGHVWEAPARREAERLRQHLQDFTLFMLPAHPPIRTFEHRMWTYDLLTPSIEELRDYRNLVGFRLFSRPRYSRFIVEFWG